MPAPRTNLAGQQVGLLTVLEFDAIRAGSAYWWCACACGKRVSVRATRLLRKLTENCGCLGYRRDPERHREAAARVGAKQRESIAKAGAAARWAG